MADFQRPNEYDPNLIKQEQAAALSQKALANDMDDLSFDNDLQNDNGAGASGAAVDPSLFVPSSEFEAVKEQLKTANQSRVKADYATRKAEERIEQLTSMHKSTQSILARRHKVQLKALRTELDETKALLSKDEDMIAALQRKAAGAAPEAGDAAALAVKESTALQLELAAVKAQLEDAAGRAQACEDEAAEYKRIAEEAQQRLTAAEAAGGSSLELAQLLKLQAQIDAAAFDRNTALGGDDDDAAAAATSADDVTGSDAAGAQLAVSVLAELDTLRRHKAEQDALIARLRAAAGGATGEEADDESAAAAGGSSAANAAALVEAEKKIKELTEELTVMAQSMATLSVAPGASAELGTLGVELASAKAALRAAQADAGNKDEAVKKSDAQIGRASCRERV